MAMHEEPLTYWPFLPHLDVKEMLLIVGDVLAAHADLAAMFAVQSVVRLVGLYWSRTQSQGFELGFAVFPASAGVARR